MKTKKMAARGIVWSDEETFDLISLWSDDSVQALLEGARHNHKIFSRLAEQLANKGYEARGGKQCQDKVRKLKLKYRSVLDNNNKSGRARKRWTFFEKMHEVLGTRPTSRPPLVLQSATEESEDENIDENNDTDDDSRSQLSEDDVESIAIGVEEDVNNHRTRPITPMANNSAAGSELEVADMDSDVELENSLLDRATTSTPVPKKRKFEKISKKTQKKSKMEKALDSTINSFTMALKEMDKTNVEIQKQRQRKEEEMEVKRLQAEEKMREKDRDHELKMMNMFLSFMSQSSTVQQQQNQQMSFTHSQHSDSRHMGASYWSL